jgi:hypothetical protein
MLGSRGSSFRDPSIKQNKLNYSGKVIRELLATAVGMRRVLCQLRESVQG